MQYSQRDFLKAVLPEAGIVCIGRLKPHKGAFFNNDKYNSIDDMLVALSQADATEENYYFAVSTFDEWEGKLTRGKMRFRSQENAKYTRCVILDVDLKSDPKFYQNKDDAFEGIRRLTFQLNMPEPIVVDSGYGYHVYWPMAAGVPSKEWQAVTKQFYQAASVIEPKLVADASRVSDSASVLRIPETYNLKFGQQVLVEVVQWYSDLLDFGDFKETLERITGKKPGAPKVSLEVVQQEYEKSPLMGTLKNCNWTAQYMKNAANASEPEWYAMLGMAHFIEHTTKDGTVVTGVELAHLFSKQHPDYDPVATENKFYQAKGAQTGPTTCGKLQQIDSSRCEGCPFKGAVKAPVQAARLSRPATEDKVVVAEVIGDDGNKQQEEVTIPRPPAPYFRGESGGVFVRIKEKVDTDDGEQWEEKIVKVYDYDLYPVKRFRSELVEEEQVEIHLWLPKDGMRRFKMPTEILTEHKKLGSFLASRGAIGEQGSSIRIAKYMVDYARHMQTETSAEVEYSRFGWRDVQSPEPKFVVGNGYVDKDGVIHPASFPSYLRDAATAVAAHGDLETWRESFDVYKKIPNSEAFIFTSLMGFASPLMALTPYAGVLVNMVGESGAGKSAALRMMSSIWGKPRENRVNVNDTQIATYNTIGYLNSVPVAFDEITNMDPHVAAQFALNFTGGRGKERAGRDGQNKENHVTWDTIVVCSSNTSMYSKFTAARRGYNAEAMRLFEMNVAPSKEAYKPIMDRAMSVIGTNYGQAGRVYIGVVMRNREALAKAIETKTNDILKRTGATNSERFWATLLACWFVGAKVAATKSLHGYDADAILEWAMGQMHVARETSGKASADPNAMLGEFINANLDSMVRVRNDKVDLTVSGSQSQRSIKGRLEYADDKLVRAIISTKSLTDYCNHHNIDAAWLLAELVRAGVTNGESKSARLATGTNLPNPTVRSITVDLIKQIGIEDGQTIPTA